MKPRRKRLLIRCSNHRNRSVCVSGGRDETGKPTWDRFLDHHAARTVVLCLPAVFRYPAPISLSLAFDIDGFNCMLHASDHDVRDRPGHGVVMIRTICKVNET